MSIQRNPRACYLLSHGFGACWNSRCWFFLWSRLRFIPSRPRCHAINNILVEALKARDPWWQRLVKLCVSWVFTSYIPLLAFGCWIYRCKICRKVNWPCFSLVFPDKNLDGSFTVPAENCGVSLFFYPMLSVSNYLLHLIILAINYLTMPCLTTEKQETKPKNPFAWLGLGPHHLSS